ncbi:MAG: SpaA isopeptide-forming pilin-related protein [Eubacteriales bacterium]
MKKSAVIFALVCAIFVAQFFGIGINLPAVYAADLTGTSSSDTPTIFDFITGLDITQTGPDNNLPPALGTDVPQNGDFRMTYSFSIPASSGLDFDDYFFLELPSYVHVPSEVLNVAIVDSSFGIHCFDASMIMSTNPTNTTGSDAILIEFSSELANPAYSALSFTGQFWFEASFDADQVDEGGSITIDFDSGRVSAPYQITIDFIEDPPVLPTLDKNVSRTWNASEHRHYYTWTLDFNPENTNVGDNVVIVDELDFLGTYMEYIGNVTQTNGTAGYTIDYDTSGANPVLSIAFTETVTERQTFTFQTALFADAYENRLATGNTLNFSNDAVAQTSAGNINSDTATSNYTMDVIDKNQNGAVDTVNRRISWEIVANENDYIINGAYVTDIIPDGLTMDDSSIEIEFTISGITYSASATPFDGIVYYSNTGQDYQFQLGDIAEEVRIRFDTTIDDDQYYDQANITYRNDAYFHPPGNSPWYTRGRRDVPVSTDVIQKSSAGIDITNGIITWQVVINPNTNSSNPVQIEDMVLIDPIPDNITTTPATTNNGLEYITGTLSISPAIDAEVASASIFYDSVNNQIVVDFDATAGADIISQMYTVTYQTQIVDGYIYKRNDNSSVTNTATYTSVNAGTGSDDATQTINPDMLQKESVSYDYDTHYFRWHIHINPNDNELTNTILTDYISEDMRYVPGTFEIFDSSSNPYSGGVFTYTDHDPSIANPQVPAENTSGTLEYVFPASVNSSYDVYFETEYIDFDQLSDNHLNLTSDYLEASNTAYLTHDEMPINEYVVITGSQRFTSSIIEKEPIYSSGNQYIDWVVTINKNQIDIYGPNPDPYPTNAYTGPVIYDTLQDGLVIDLQSIILYDATVDSAGNVTRGSQVSFNVDQVTLDAASLLTFEFANAINSCYIIEFTTYIESGYSGPFDNTASFHALAGNPNNTSDEQNVNFATGGGYAAANIGHLLLRKIDAESGDPLQGAFFELIDEYGNVLDVQETDASGEALFEFIFFDRQYYYRESQAPYGYSGDTTTLFPFVIDTATATDEMPVDPDRTYTPAPIENTANLVSVEFMKYIDGTATGLQGATFAIFDASAPSVQIATATSDATGLVTFSDLPANRTYNIQEIIPPFGYDLNTTILTVTVTVGNVPFTPTPGSITNTPNALAIHSVSLLKYADDGVTPLAGCVFGIYPSAVPTALMATATSDASGLVRFNNVPEGSYVVREISTMPTYELSTVEALVTVDSSATDFWTTPSSIINYLDGAVEVEIHSTFSLAGTSFRIGLYDRTSRSLVGTLSYVNGSLTNFTNLPYGTYFATIMPNRRGLIGQSQNGTITISASLAHVDIYITRNPQTGDSISTSGYLIIALTLLLTILGYVTYTYTFSKKKLNG